MLVMTEPPPYRQKDSLVKFVLKLGVDLEPKLITRVEWWWTQFGQNIKAQFSQRGDI